MSVPYGIIHHNNLVSRIQSKVNNVMLYCTSVFWKKYFLAYFRRLAISRAWSSFWASFKLNYMFCETTWLDREFGIPFYYSEHVRNFSSTFSSKKTTFKKGDDELSEGVALHTKVSCVFQNYFSTSFYLPRWKCQDLLTWIFVSLLGHEDSWYSTSTANYFCHFFWPLRRLYLHFRLLLLVYQALQEWRV